VRTPNQVRTHFYVGSRPQHSEFVAAERYKETSRAGLDAARARIISSQHATLHPCSLIHCHHALRGAMKTRGASFGCSPRFWP